MRVLIILRARFWWLILNLALTWCRICRGLHRRADQLCGWLARKAEGAGDPPGPGWTAVENDQGRVIETVAKIGKEDVTIFGPN